MAAASEREITVSVTPFTPTLDPYVLDDLRDRFSPCPGNGFSDRPTRPGMDVARIAGVVVDVMGQLGYDRFAARGSDLGAGVLQQLALAHPDRLVALHLS